MINRFVEKVDTESQLKKNVYNLFTKESRVEINIKAFKIKFWMFF